MIWDNAGQHSTTSTYYKQVDMTDVPHTEITAFAKFPTPVPS